MKVLMVEGLLVVVIVQMVAYVKSMGAQRVSQEHIVNREDTDRIFGFNRAQWETYVKTVEHPPGWSTRLAASENGTRLMALDSTTGTGLSVQPMFFNMEGPPKVLMVTSYYPSGTFREFTDAMKQRMEADAKADLGPDYEVQIMFNRTPIIEGLSTRSLDEVTVMITRAKAAGGK